MDEQERAREIARAVHAALERNAEPVSAPDVCARSTDMTPQSRSQPRFAIVRQQGCLACDPGACWECGYLFSGERIVITHVSKGERVLSDRTLHLLTHGITHYQTKYVVYGEPVIVDLELDELAGYLDL